ncbi:DUF2797 domain-containing protein [Marinobacter confluentis]|uniref:DUF2797 domain-containing protein n=2 Tax=Marinobacter confluentis TaxID=1697557 RepID=A0A4Z1BRK6_9GAMM|nr:DUF2797 domain-containing protein [Marinobacter confluentis]TGN39879.1 DUF2797 domain-containing protein [Marinobacter confluentis]
MTATVDITGRLRKMPAEAGSPVSYSLLLGDTRLPMNELLGQSVRLDFDGVIRCINCDRKTSKSFSQGFCFPCFRKLAACDTCIMSPEKCHYHEGTCREPEWGETHCMVEHVVYLANSSGLKVGITRGTQVPTRWIDQGAVDAIPMLRVATRQLAGFVEVACKQHVADRTNWRTMLKGEAPEMDLAQERDRLLALIADDLAALQAEHGEDAIRPVSEDALGLSYPVSVWPEKVKTHNLDKAQTAEGVLQGIKGQYLILDTGVINIRKYTGYEVRFRVFPNS